MSQIHDTINIVCPANEVKSRLTEFFHQREGKNSTILRIPLEVPLKIGGKKFDFRLHRDTIFCIREANRYAGNTHVLFDIDWQVALPGPFPYFSGTLSFDEGKNGSRLLLDGIYIPPFGFIGKLFDDAVGHAIGCISIRTLLEKIGAAIEHPERH